MTALRTFARQYQTEEEISALRDEEGGSNVPYAARPAQIEVGRAQRQALEAFEAGRCVVLVGERA